MDVSYEWLQELVDVPVTPEELADKVSRTGIEVASVRYPDEQRMKKVVVGRVQTLTPHPDSDHLQVAMVDIGEDELSQIVCGAPNVAENQLVIVALPNSRIGDNVKIKKGKMRGVVSNGMICALQELGFAESLVPKAYADGIYVFPESAGLKPGDDALEALGMHDAILDFDITPNRADALGMRGVAWEVGATYNNRPHLTEPSAPQTAGDVHELLNATVLDAHDAPSYQLRMVADVKIAESPLWLQRRLWNAGVRPINNVVDVTNLIMLTYGQPLHAFDYDHIGSQEIVVRHAQQNEPFTTLDGEERTLDDEDIVITNGTVPLALAGVMGGLDSEVTSETTRVVIESASFDPTAIRKTALKYNLRSEASSRFEKGTDLGAINTALDAAVALIAELGEGTALDGTVAGSSLEAAPETVAITLTRLNHVLGTDLGSETVGQIFDQLGFAYELNGGRFDVAVPTRRWDIHLEADLVEEVARIYGYDNLPSTLPTTTMTIGQFTPQQARIRRTRTVLEGLGLTQVMSYALTTEEKASRFTLEDKGLKVVAHPMTIDHAALRMNLVSGLLDAVAYNVARKQTDLALYEEGRVFLLDEGDVRPREVNYLAGALTGDLPAGDWHRPAQKVDFYQVKGYVDAVIADYRLSDAVTYTALTDDPTLHPGQSASIYLDGQLVGLIGRLHPSFERAQDLPATFVFELDLAALFEATRRTVIAKPAPKYPSVTRDVALLLPLAVTNAEVLEVMRETGGKYLIDITLFDLYTGDNLGVDQKSLAYSLTYQREDSTLTEEEVNAAFEKLADALTTRLGAQIR